MLPREMKKKLWKNRLLLYLPSCPHLMRSGNGSSLPISIQRYECAPHLTLAPTHLRIPNRRRRRRRLGAETHLCVFYSVVIPPNRYTHATIPCRSHSTKKRKDISFRLLCSFTLRARYVCRFRNYDSHRNWMNSDGRIFLVCAFSSRYPIHYSWVHWIDTLYVTNRWLTYEENKIKKDPRMCN